MRLRQSSSKSVRYILTLPVTLLIVLFAVSNRQEVSVELWPLGPDFGFPLYAVVLVSLATGLVFGVVVAWLSGVSTRRRACAAERKVRELEKEISSLAASKSDL